MQMQRWCYSEMLNLRLWWMENLLISLGRGGRSGSNGRGSVGNGGSWWTKWASKVMGLCGCDGCCCCCLQLSPRLGWWSRYDVVGGDKGEVGWPELVAGVLTEREREMAACFRERKRAAAKGREKAHGGCRYWLCQGLVGKEKWTVNREGEI